MNNTQTHILSKEPTNLHSPEAVKDDDVVGPRLKCPPQQPHFLNSLHQSNKGVIFVRIEQHSTGHWRTVTGGVWRCVAETGHWKNDRMIATQNCHSNTNDTTARRIPTSQRTQCTHREDSNPGAHTFSKNTKYLRKRDIM